MRNDEDQSNAAANCIPSFVLRRHFYRTAQVDELTRRLQENMKSNRTPLKAQSQKKKSTNTAKRRKETNVTPPAVTTHTERPKYIYNFQFLTLKNTIYR